MLIIVVGCVVVIGACLALAWHHRERMRGLSESAESHERRFAQEQYARRSLTTTLIGVLGLTLMAFEVVKSTWGDLLVLVVMTALVITIPLLAGWDFRATRNYFRRHDQGVRQATRELIDELKRVEAQRQERDKDRESQG